ncbi:MAG: cytochrome c oxidase subunit 3 family protein [Vicinamibacterales bacterium]
MSSAHREIPRPGAGQAHAQHPALAHHFDSLEQQQEASTLGMWVFLVTEIMFFGGLFMAYIVYRTWHPDAFAAGSAHLDIPLGATNTAVLIGSSLTMALAVHAAQTSWRRGQIVFLLLTIALGATFLVIKAFEYADKFTHHLVPGPHFQWPDEKLKAPVEMFYSLYFAMTGLHALHMVIGIGIMLWLLWMARRGRFSAEYFSPVEVSGLYWHFVDIVWIFLFPLLYLIGAHVRH